MGREGGCPIRIEEVEGEGEVLEEGVVGGEEEGGCPQGRVS